MASPFIHPRITTGLQFRQTLAAGPYAWPGGYPLALLCSDSEALCFTCGKQNAAGIIRAIRDKSRCGWRVEACFVNWEDEDLTCAHCNKGIPSAYGGEDDGEPAATEEYPDNCQPRFWLAGGNDADSLHRIGKRLPEQVHNALISDHWLAYLGGGEPWAHLS